MTQAHRSRQRCWDALPGLAAGGTAGRGIHGTDAKAQFSVPDMLWDPVRHRGQARLLFIARPGPEVGTVLDAAITEQGVSSRLGHSAFDSCNWHQSLSDRYIDTPALRRQLMSVGEAIGACAVTMHLDRIQSPRNQRGSFNWELRGHPGERDLLVPLVTEIKRAVVLHNLPVTPERNRPHITLSYGAQSALPRDLAIDAIAWTIDAIELVVGDGQPYHYIPLGCWPLRPEMPRITQRALF